MLPTGRGLYLWKTERCEGGDVARIVDRALACGVSWVAVKAGDQGRPWRQFTPGLVRVLQTAGLKVFGWSYDVPGKAVAQAEVVRRVRDAGADGFVIDAEIEFDRTPDPDGEARRYMEAIRKVAPDLTLFDAPWPLIHAHQSFPFTAFGEFLQGRCPQVYWVELGGGVAKVWARYDTDWDRYESRPGHLALPEYPSGSLYHKRDEDRHLVTPCVPADVAAFEAFAKAEGCPGVLHWEWSQVPKEVWAAFETGAIPRW